MTRPFDDTDEPETSAIVGAFLARLLEDRQRGIVLPAEHYAADYPGYESAVAAEFARLHAGEAAGAEPPAMRRIAGSEAGRYRIEGELGRGGMGTIYRVWDPSLRRNLAMKVLRDERAPGTPGSGIGLLDRFLEEAQVTAQLEHPGIVPVHDLGVDSDGRAFFTMSMVRGQSLERIFDLVRSGRDGWTRTRALGVLQRVCEAVAFAHSKGVVHRDLKPANVMVGHFGETYVVDWGLARVHGADHAADDVGAVRTTRRDVADCDRGSPLATAQGDVVGTPAYMAPEQARGDLAAIGPAADVYAIGATLYHLLAGRAPYSDAAGATTWRAVCARVDAGPPTPLDQHAPRAPSELLAICDKAMARDPADRYADVGALGADLRAFLESRVVRAHATGAWAEARKWVQRNRVAAAAAAAAVIALTAGVIASTMLERRADANARRAEAGYAGALEAVDRMLTRVGESSLADVPGADPVRKDLLADARELYQRFLAEHGQRPELRRRVARAHGQLATILEQLGERDEAERRWRTAAELLAELSAADPGSASLAADHVWAVHSGGRLAQYAGRAEAAESTFRRVLALTRSALERHPDDPALRSWESLGEDGLSFALYYTGRREESLEHARRSFAIRDELVRRTGQAAHLRKLAASGNGLGFQLVQAGATDEAERVLDRCIAAAEDLLATETRDRELREGLANLLVSREFVHKGKGEVEGRQRTLARALELYRGLVTDFPHAPGYRSSVGAALHNRGNLHTDTGGLEVALADFEAAIVEQRLALQASPGHSDFLLRLSNHLRSRDWTWHRLGRYRDIAEHADELPQLDPDHADHWRHTGKMLLAAGDLAGRDASLPLDERARRRERLVEDGVARLRTAVTKGFRDAAWLRRADFDHVREHPAFRSLVETVEEASTKHEAQAVGERARGR